MPLAPLACLPDRSETAGFHGNNLNSAEREHVPRPFAFLQPVRAAVMLLLAPFLTLLVSFLALVSMVVFRASSQAVQAFPRWWGRVIVRGSGVQVTIDGLEKLERGRPYIFAGNHASQFDIFVLQGFLRYDFRWLAKKELFSIPLFGTALRLSGSIPVDREHGRKALQSLNEAAQRIADGTAVIIFPEGTRSPDGKLQPFKSGGMVLAIKSGVPIVPMAISGSYEVLPKGAKLAKAGHIRIRLGDPVDTKAYTLKQKGELAADLHDRVAALLAMEGERKEKV